MTSWLRSATGFAVKEIREVLRQPRLIVTLVLGPFLILLILGMGYRDARPQLQTAFVAGDAQQQATIEEWAELIANRVDVASIGTDGEQAMSLLRAGELDAVVVFPDDPEEEVLASRTAPIEIFHNKLDPFDAAYIEFVGRLGASRINEEVLESLAAEGQEQTAGLEQALNDADEASEAFGQAVAEDNGPEAVRQRRLLADALDRVVTESVSLAQVDPESADDERLQTLQASAELLRQDDANLQTQATVVAELQVEVSGIRDRLAEVRDIDPQVLVRPFRSEVASVASEPPDEESYYSPGVVALLLQHLAITFAALSLVAEDRLGALELFRVAPVRTSQMLTGKYVGYAVMTGVVAVALSAGLFWLFGAPLAGSIVMYGGVVGLVLVSSLGLGFILSALARSDSQAIQFSMLTLLASIFLSGFFLSSSRLEPAVQWVAQVLPVTHGIELLRQEMFLGSIVEPTRLWVLAGLAGVYAIAAWVLGARRLAAD